MCEYKEVPFVVKQGAVVIGCRFNTYEFIETLLYEGKKISGIVTVSEKVAKKTNVPAWVNLKEKYGDRIPVYEATSYKLVSSRDKKVLSRIKADTGLCIGWQRILPTWFLERFRNGIFGMHASQFFLPRGRGRSPIVWGLINGATVLQGHIFRYTPDPDEGELLAIEPIPVSDQDTVHTVQMKCRVAFNRIVDRYWDDLLNGEPSLFPQQMDEEPLYYPKRTPSSGHIDWRWSTKRILDWIRAQTRPYPGAFTYLWDRLFHVWKAQSFGFRPAVPASPGTILEVFWDGSLLVQTGDDTILLTDHELVGIAQRGDVLS